MKFTSIIFFYICIICNSCSYSQKNNKDQLEYKKEIQNDLLSVNSNMAFTKNGDVFLYNSKNKKISTLFIKDGSNVTISPNGDKIAFVRNRNIIDIINNTSSKKKKTINGEYVACTNLIWNNKGNMLAFNVFKNGVWKIGIMLPDGSQKFLSPKQDNYFGVAWTYEDNTILTHDTKNLYFIDLNGNILKQIPIFDFFKEGVSSSTIFMQIKNSNYYIFNTVNISNTSCKNEYTPNLPDAIYKFNLATLKSQKLTYNDENIVSYELDGDTLYYASNNNCFKGQTSIYKKSLWNPDGQKITVITKGINKISIQKNKMIEDVDN